MTRRSYDQYCALARALDVMGERWTLLLVRELMPGPRRFKDLIAGLPGIGTNLLAARLKELSARGVIEQIELPRPASTSAYALTERGRELEPALLALTRWGEPLLGPPREQDAFRPAWLLVALRARFRPEAAPGLRATWEYRIDGDVLHIRIADDAATTHDGPAAAPDMVCTTDSKTLLAVASGTLDVRKAMAAGALVLDDPHGMLDTSLRVFDVPDAVPPRSQNS